MIYKTNTDKETKQFAAKLAGSVSRLKNKKATVISLRGDLGAGKTVFSKGFLSAFGIKKVLSPTFVIMKRYRIKSAEFKNIYHFDCYRLGSPEELEVLKIKDILSDPENIILMEWPERAGKYGHGNNILINHGKSETERLIKTNLVI